jgi:hypothetical protein
LNNQSTILPFCQHVNLNSVTYAEGFIDLTISQRYNMKQSGPYQFCNNISNSIFLYSNLTYEAKLLPNSLMLLPEDQGVFILTSGCINGITIYTFQRYMVICGNSSLPLRTRLLLTLYNIIFFVTFCIIALSGFGSIGCVYLEVLF